MTMIIVFFCDIPENVFEDLDKPFTEKELEECINKLKRNKSPGEDNILNEYILESKTVIMPILCKLFNVILMTGSYPERWVKSILVPLFKKGPVNDPGNYRGISLVSNVGKLFTATINARLVKWSDENNVLSDAQFGFRPGYGTHDAIFALHSIVSKSLRNGKRIYCCFIDYKKAFDSVSHFRLWLKLVRYGVTGKLLNLMKTMYSKLKSCVKSDGIFSEFFDCKVGLMQGESLSPFLYAMYVNDVETELIKEGCQSYELKMLNLYLLMYADDTVIFSENIAELQKMIDVINTYSSNYNLHINLSKTKVVVFRNKGIIKPEEKWFINGQPIESCNEFVYLGILLKYNGTFNSTQKTLSNQGKKAVFNLFSKIQDDYFNTETLLSLFDTYIASIVNYGCEVWGSHKAPDIETVHLQFLKRILKVKNSTANYMVYFELGRLPLYVQRYCRMIKYWCKLLKTENCILQNCYKEMYESSLVKPNDKLNWSCKIRDLLCNNGFNYVWLSQNVINEDGLIAEFKQRITDKFITEATSFFEESPKCIFYRYMYDNHCLQFYLSKPVNYRYKPLISKYRLHAHNLNIETGRYFNIDRNERKCNMCDGNYVEDEYHFILC